MPVDSRRLSFSLSPALHSVALLARSPHGLQTGHSTYLAQQGGDATTPGASNGYQFIDGPLGPPGRTNTPTGARASAASAGPASPSAPEYSSMALPANNKQEPDLSHYSELQASGGGGGERSNGKGIFLGMFGFYGWLLWLAFMVGFYGWLRWLRWLHLYCLLRCARLHGE